MKEEVAQTTRIKYGFLEAWVSIAGNTGLFIAKITIGLTINSISLIADAFHTFSDILTSVMVLIGFMISGMPADEHHPYGHGRMEGLATLIIAVLLGVVSYEFGKDSIERLIHPQPVRGTLFAIFVMLGSAFGKELMARFSFSLGKKIDSAALYADAWHHRSDAIASMLIPIAIVASMFKIYRIDAVFGLGVSVLIGYTGFQIAYSTIDKLLGHAPDRDFVEKIKKDARSVPGVKDVHGIAVHNYGDTNAISMHIEVDENINLARAHEIATEVENKVTQGIKGVATVHIEIKEGSDGR